MGLFVTGCQSVTVSEPPQAGVRRTLTRVYLVTITLSKLVKSEAVADFNQSRAVPGPATAQRLGAYTSQMSREYAATGRREDTPALML